MTLEELRLVEELEKRGWCGQGEGVIAAPSGSIHFAVGSWCVSEFLEVLERRLARLLDEKKRGMIVFDSTIEETRQAVPTAVKPFETPAGRV
ncbi:MAG: hypothetical protein R3B89_35410 [Polyangiaceae bacterium]